ncbi:hypothetical protein [Sphingobium aquiterrae]|uniref:hypothetical protein n=1 Tax=Sphingobium aquiterrae TaxID=2038656 RepID=UPI003016398C
MLAGRAGARREAAIAFQMRQQLRLPALRGDAFGRGRLGNWRAGIDHFLHRLVHLARYCGSDRKLHQPRRNHYVRFRLRLRFLPFALFGAGGDLLDRLCTASGSIFTTSGVDGATIIGLTTREVNWPQRCQA